MTYAEWRRSFVETLDLDAAYSALSWTVAEGGTIYACGCGGSYTQASHFVGELLGGMRRKDGPPIRAVTLGAEIASLTAIANDVDWQATYVRALRGATRRDALVAFTTSGASPVVLAALDDAQRVGMRTVAITGPRGLSAAYASVIVRLNGEDTASIQELTLVALHELASRLEEG